MGTTEPNSEMRARGSDGTRRFQTFEEWRTQTEECGHGRRMDEGCPECLELHRRHSRATGEL